MAASSTISVSSLPARNNPGYAVRVSLDSLSKTITKAERVLAPPFWKRLLGGTTKDHARAVVASCVEETRPIRGTLSEVRKAAIGNNSAALVGTVDRVVKVLDEWREGALEFDAAIFGSDIKLLDLSKRLHTLCTDLKNPGSGIA